MRFCAFLLVFIAHSDLDVSSLSWRQPHLAKLYLAVHDAGFSGVTLFFCLSSYLITELLLRENERTGSIHFRDFYFRRILRIWPLYFFFLLCVRPIAGIFIPGEHFSGHYLAAFLLLVGNWQCVLHGWPPSVAAPLWSISIEEQFYLIWPFTVSRLRYYLPSVALLMLLVANLVRIYMAVHPGPDPDMWASTLARLDPFALGALLAYFLHGRSINLSTLDRLLLISLGAILLLVLGRVGGHMGKAGLVFYPIEGIACSLLLFATWRPVRTWQPGPLGRGFIYLGRISYGLYVFHLLFLTLLAARLSHFLAREVSAFAITIAAASLSYAFLEKPFLRLKQRFTYVHSRL